MNILSLDLGDTCGWAWIGQSSEKTQNPDISIDSNIAMIDYGHFSSKTYAPWASNLLDLLDRFTVDIIVCSQTNSFRGKKKNNEQKADFTFSPSRKMLMRLGICCYIGEKKGIPVIELNDSSARKAALGFGEKNKVKAHLLFDKKFPMFSGATGDEKDALCLGMAWQKLQKES